MRLVVLIGDSIRLGYQETVRRELAGKAEVWVPAENGEHTVNTLRNFYAWVRDRRPDLVHINSGLHDLKTVPYEGRDNLVPLSHYRENVERLLRLILAVPARAVWATTTPVNEANANAAHARVRDFRRFEADVTAYNRAARDAADKLGVPVNDLNARVLEAGRDRVLLPDGVHYTPEGYEMLGKAVAAAIAAQLDR